MYKKFLRTTALLGFKRNDKFCTKPVELIRGITQTRLASQITTGDRGSHTEGKEGTKVYTR